MTQQKWYDKPIIDSYVHPTLEKIGGPKTFGAATAALSLPAWYLVSHLLGHEFTHWRPLTLSALTGVGGWYGTRPANKLAVPKDPAVRKKAWAASFLPTKTSSDLLATPIPAHNLLRRFMRPPVSMICRRAFCSMASTTPPLRTRGR